MKIEISQTPDGLPKVAWIQSTSETGETRESRNYKWMLVIGMVAGFLYGWGQKNLWLMLGGPLAGFIAVGAAYAHGQQQLAKNGPDPREKEPILVKQYCEASLVRRGDALFLTWWMKGKSYSDSFELPLDEVSHLVLGGYNEWFAEKGSSKKFHESLTIVMPLADGRVFRLADHVGSQSDLAHLHTVLTAQFVEPRDRLLRLLGAERRAARHAGASGADVPDKL